MGNSNGKDNPRREAKKNKQRQDRAANQGSKSNAIINRRNGGPHQFVNSIGGDSSNYN